MTLKKTMNSQKIEAVIIKSDPDEGTKFPPGFQYELDGIIYTVEKNITKDAHNQMRRLKTSTGDTEEVSIDTIVRDLKEENCRIIEEDDKK